MNQYAILTRSDNFNTVIAYIKEHNLDYEVHLNRTRFWVPDNLHVAFLSQFGSMVNPVHPQEDLMTGMITV